MYPTTKAYILIIFTCITLTCIRLTSQSQTKERVNSTTESLIASLAQYDFTFGNKSYLVSQNSNRDEEILEISDNKTLNLNESKYCIQSMLAKTIFSNDSNNDPYRMELSWKAETKMKYLKLQGHPSSENNSNCDFGNKLIYTSQPEDKDKHTFRHKDRYISITPTCSYEIRVAMRGECEPFTLKYTIPVCLEGMDGKCFKCVNDTQLPAPIFRVTVKPKGVIVFWKIPKMDKEILKNTQKIVLIIDPVRTLLSEQTIVKEVYLDNFLKHYVQNGTYYFPMNKTEKLKHQAIAQLVDVFDCPGEKAEVDFDFPSMAPLPENPSTANEVWIILVFFLLFFLVISIIYIYLGRCNTETWKRLIGRRQRSADNYMNNNRLISDLETRLVTNPMYSAEPIKDSYLIDFRNLNIVEKLGEGEFGVVYKAQTIKDVKGHKLVAVKQLKKSAPPDHIYDFIEEIKIFRKAGTHENIVKMLGYCKEPLSIVMEYLVFLNLHKYLENLRTEFNERKSVSGSVRYVKLQHSCYPQSSEYNYISHDEIASKPEFESKADDPLTIVPDKTSQRIECKLDNKELETFALQIANGMEHLEKQNIVHRDLAARNILMDANKRLKISDFGMSRIGIYVNKRSGKVPLRWMAPEAVEFLTFSNKSDVWSYGVVLWEIGTLAAFPYGGLNDGQVINFLKKGGHLDQPENITAQLYEIMMDCWAKNPEDRPTFGEVVQKLESLYSITHAYVDFSNLKSNYIFPPTEEEVQRKKKKNGVVAEQEEKK